MSSAQKVLDQVQSVADIEALESDPARHANLLATEISVGATLAELETVDSALSAALLSIDGMVARVMKILLEHALATDTSIGPPTRRVFASTVVSYVGNLPLLAQRARDVAARAGAADPDATAHAVTDAARSALALRDGVRAGVIDLIRARATAGIPVADRWARDRNLDDAERRRWSAARRDLEAVAIYPEHVLASPMTARLAVLPEQLDEPTPEREVRFADLLELD